MPFLYILRDFTCVTIHKNPCRSFLWDRISMFMFSFSSQVPLLGPLVTYAQYLMTSRSTRTQLCNFFLQSAGRRHQYFIYRPKGRWMESADSLTCLIWNIRSPPSHCDKRTMSCTQPLPFPFPDFWLLRVLANTDPLFSRDHQWTWRRTVFHNQQ